MYIDNIKEFKELLNESEKYVVYGAGAVGKAVAQYLVECGISINSIQVVVSEKKKEFTSICGVNICEVNDSQIDWGSQSLVIVSVMGDLKNDIASIVANYSDNYIVFSDSMCLELRHRSGDFEYEKSQIFGQVESLKSENEMLSAQVKRLSPQNKLQYLVLNILDHCNLNCRGCDHFSPIAKERCISADIICADLERLSEVMSSNVDRIGIMGGEPLLHPELCRIIKKTRECFHDTIIQVDTNGLLLMQQGDEFWDVCRESDAIILQTKYPINLDFEKISALCREKGVKHEYYGNTGDVLKTSYKIPFNLNGDCDINDSFSKCFHANYCVTLQEGRIYPCTVAPTAHIFRDRFEKSMELCEQDCLDIYDENLTEQTVLNFLATPIPFCRYCDVNGRSYGHEWEISEGKMEEWVNE